MRKQLDSVTPELADTIRTLVDAMLVDMNIAVPAKVVKYDSETQYADVQVQLQAKYEDGSVINLPVIPNVPVNHPRAFGGKAHIHFPVQIGDDVTLVFSHRSLDNWKTQGGLTDPADRRKFHITDAVALLGGSAIPDAFAVTDPTAIEIVNDQLKVQVHKDGKLQATNSTAELLDTLSQITSQAQELAATLGTDTTNTFFGPMPLNAFATYTAIGNQLSSLLTKLNSFVGT